MTPFEITETRFKLLKELSKNSSNPKSLSQKLRMTLANVSHQLKYLEATNILKKERVDKGDGTRKKKDVRISYSLNKELATIININKSQSYYKQVTPTKMDSLLLNLIGEEDAKYILKYLLVEETTHIQALALKDSTPKEIHLLVITNNTEKFRNHNRITIEACEKKDLVFWSHTLDEFKKGLQSSDSYYVKALNSSKIIFEEHKELTELKNE